MLTFCLFYDISTTDFVNISSTFSFVLTICSQLNVKFKVNILSSFAMVFLKLVVIFKANTVILYKGGIVLLQFPQVYCYKPMKFSGFEWDYKTYV